LDATFPHDDLDQLLGDQHQERGPMLRGLWHGVLVGAAVGLVAGIAVGALLVTMSFGSLSSFATVFMTGAIGVAIGATAGAVYEAPRSEEIADEREVIRRRS
jgi:hypothetical protein